MKLFYSNRLIVFILLDALVASNPLNPIKKKFSCVSTWKLIIIAIFKHQKLELRSHKYGEPLSININWLR